MAPEADLFDVDFAGPYYEAGQDIMVPADNPQGIQGPDDLAGKNVCSVEGSTPAQTVRGEHPEAQLTLSDVYSKCADARKNGQVDAVTTDNVILTGLATFYVEAFRNTPLTVVSFFIIFGLPEIDFVIGFFELLRQARNLVEFFVPRFGDRYTFQLYVAAGLMYIIVNVLLSQLAEYVERRTGQNAKAAAAEPMEMPVECRWPGRRHDGAGEVTSDHV